MNRSLSGLLLVLSLSLLSAALSAGCIEANRPQFAPPDTSTGDTGEPSTATDTSVEPDAPDVATECDEQRPCLQQAQCVSVVCEAGACVPKNKSNTVVCDDGDGCSGPDLCLDGECEPGPALADNTVCDDNDQFCDGYGLCQGGACEPQVVGNCPQNVVGVCMRGSECSEEANGACVPSPVEDGEGCELADKEGTCSRGVCTPPGMVWVPAGVFDQGCDNDNALICQVVARPHHDVMLSGFAIERTEIDEAAWGRCATGGACTPRSNEALHSQDEDTAPATELDYLRAVQVCKSRGRQLCSEAQWEKAARADNEFNFPWGNSTATCDQAHFKPAAGPNAGPGCGTGAVDVVGERPAGASPYGVLDMAGNVWEWVADGYIDSYQSFAPGVPVDPLVKLDANDTQIYVLRGGGWRSPTGEIYVHHRRAELVETTDVDVGARCCWTPGIDGGTDPGSEP